MSALHREYATFVSGFVQRLGVRATDVPDLVQEVFLLAHEKGGYREGAASPRTWLANLAVGKVRNLRRKQSRRSAVAPDSRAVNDAPDLGAVARLDEQLDRRQRLQIVQRALDRLDEDSRIVFMLYELEGERCAAIAAGLGIALGTVHSRLHGARRKFKAAFEQENDER
ncbi:MAG: RNA polymerase sigma factor [Myxococcota bacterium]